MEEFSVFGVYVPSFLLAMLVALLLSRLVTAVLARCGAYRWVWHRSLFDFCVYVLTLAGLYSCVSGVVL